MGLQERAHVLDEGRVVELEQSPLRHRERLVARARNAVQVLEALPRCSVGEALVVDVAPFDVDEGGARVIPLGRVTWHAWVIARKRAPDDPEPREGVDREVSAVERWQPELRELRVDGARRAAVKDHVDARERFPIARRRMGGVSWPAVCEVTGPKRARAFHLGHWPDIDPLAPHGDCLVEGDQVPVALARRDAARRDRLALAPPLRAEMNHRDRGEAPEEDGKARAVGATLVPAEECLVDVRDLTCLTVEARDVAGDSEERP